MRVFYPIKAGQLLLTVVCLALMLNNKLLCVYKNPLDGFNQEQIDCHATLVQKIFETLDTTRNGTELAEETRLNSTRDKSDHFGTLIQTAISSLINGTSLNGTELVEETEEHVVLLKESSGMELMEESSGEASGETALNGSELGSAGNETKFHLRACLSINSRDVYDPKSQLTPLFSLRVFCLLILELLLLVLQMARDMTSYEVPDQLTIMLNNVMHGFCWLMTAVVLFLLKVGWQEEWSSLSPDFVPVYPTEYEWAELIAWLNLVFLLAEAVLFHNCIYYDLTWEKMEEQLVHEQPTVIVANYKDSDKLLLHHEHN